MQLGATRGRSEAHGQLRHLRKLASVCGWVRLLNELLLVASLPELPYGWEKIDDPVYGSYYVE